MLSSELVLTIENNTNLKYSLIKMFERIKKTLGKHILSAEDYPESIVNLAIVLSQDSYSRLQTVNIESCIGFCGVEGNVETRSPCSMS